MHAIASGLDPDHCARAESIWRLLDIGCGLRGVYRTPIPHFSYQVSASYDFEGLAAVLTDLAAGQKPFQVRTAGLGVFTGGSDAVLYLAVVKDRLLFEMQERIWQAALPFSSGEQAYYAPTRWVPHITLAHADLDAARLACAARLLAAEPLGWEIPVDHLLVIRQDPGQTGSVATRIPLGSTGAL